MSRADDAVALLRELIALSEEQNRRLLAGETIARLLDDEECGRARLETLLTALRPLPRTVADELRRYQALKQAGIERLEVLTAETRRQLAEAEQQRRAAGQPPGTAAAARFIDRKY